MSDNDAFISYSHAADQRFAEALERALQQFAKPWYKRRALQVFRDHGNLNLSPHLWGSIQSALDSSRYFIFLASPGSAQSEWCGKEVEHWKAHRDRNKIIVVVTDGAIVWDRERRDFDGPQSSSIPDAMQGVFEDEPFYLDARGLREQDDLSLRNPHFKQSVVQIAAALHNRSVEDMVGEEVDQHRRITRLRNGVIFALTLLLIVAVGLAVYAFQQRDIARAQTIVANEQTRLAREKAKDAALRMLALEARTEWPSSKWGEDGVATARFLYDRLPDDPRVLQIVYAVLNSAYADGPLHRPVYRTKEDGPSLAGGTWADNRIVFIEGNRTIVVADSTSTPSDRPTRRTLKRDVTGVDVLDGGVLLARHGTEGFTLSASAEPSGEVLAERATGTTRVASARSKFYTFTASEIEVFNADGSVAAKIEAPDGRSVVQVAADADAEQLAVWTADANKKHQLALYAGGEYVRLLMNALPSSSNAVEEASHSLAFSPDGTRVIALCQARWILIGTDGTVLATHDFPSSLPLIDVGFVSDGTIFGREIAGEVGGAQLFTAGGTRIGRIEGIAFNGGLAVSNRRIATLAFGWVNLWSTNGQSLFRTRVRRDTESQSLVFSPDGRRLLMTTQHSIDVIGVDPKRIQTVPFPPDAPRQPNPLATEIIQ